MTFYDQLILVAISVTLSVLVSRLLVFWDARKARKHSMNQARQTMLFFAKELKNGIANNMYEEAEHSYKRLLVSYDIISTDLALKEWFSKLDGFYRFSKAGGYSSVPYRRETDINEIYQVITEVESELKK